MALPWRRRAAPPSRRRRPTPPPAAARALAASATRARPLTNRRHPRSASALLLLSRPSRLPPRRRQARLEQPQASCGRRPRARRRRVGPAQSRARAGAERAARDAEQAAAARRAPDGRLAILGVGKGEEDARTRPAAVLDTRLHAHREPLRCMHLAAGAGPAAPRRRRSPPWPYANTRRR